MAQALCNISQTNDISNNGYLILDLFDDNLTWYRDIIMKQKKQIQFSGGNDPHKATKVIALRPATKKNIQDHYYGKVIYAAGSVYYYQISGPKPPPADSLESFE